MTKSPPLLSIEVLRRVLRVAHFDGTCVLTVAGALALASAAYHDFTGTGVGLVVAGAGAVELHGAALMRHGEERGMRWLIASQLCLMAAILGYVGWRLSHIDVSILRPMLTDDVRRKIKELDWTEAQYLHFAYVCGYAVIAAGTVIYQGCMAIYYSRRRTPVAAALREMKSHSSA